MRVVLINGSGGRLDDPDEGPKALAEARDLGRRLAEAIRGK